MKFNKKLYIPLSIIIVFSLIFACLKIQNNLKYSMDDTTLNKWNIAISEYEDWKNTTYKVFSDYQDSVDDCLLDDSYTYSELLDDLYFVKEREPVLSSVDNIFLLKQKFPKKYQKLFEQICNLYAEYYIISLDYSQSLLSDQALSSTQKITNEIFGEISKLEKYLYKTSLNPQQIKYSTYKANYTPYTLSYEFSSTKKYVSPTPTNKEVSSALSKAKTYCFNLRWERDDIFSIDYNDQYEYSYDNESFYFEFSALFYGTETSVLGTHPYTEDKVGTVTVRKVDEGYKVSYSDFD